MDCMGAWIKSFMFEPVTLIGFNISLGNMLEEEGLGDKGSGEPTDRIELVNIGLRSGEAPL